MSACDSVSCEHLKALNIINENFVIIQNENNDLKREIGLLRSGQIPCLPSDNNYYQRWVETNKENQELNSKLVDTRRLVADLRPRLTQILQSVENIEQTLDHNKDKQTVDKVNSQTKPASEYDEDEATDIEDIKISTDLPSGPLSELSTSSVPLTNQTSSCLELVPVRKEPLFDLQVLPEEKPIFTECSVCHESFPQFYRPEIKTLPGPSFCDKCKLPQTTTPGSRGITFQYPKGMNSSSTELCVMGTQDPNEQAAQYSSQVNDKPYQCQMCGKKFTRSHGLTKHIRIHTGEKPYICKICGKSFAVSGRLALHIRIHTGEKPHECKFCGKRFNESSKLKIHYRRHTGEKPFTCEVCDRGFSQMSTLTTHCRRHLTEKRNQCGKCGNGFRNPNALRGHRCLQICDATLDVQNNSETILGNDT